MSKLVRLQRREQSSDGVNWYPLDAYRVAYVIEEESNCQDDDIVYTKWVNTSEFECENGTKHFLAKKQLSYDNQSWFDANPIEYRRNGITVSGAWECQGIEPTAPYSRLVETDLWECGDNYTKHYLSERQFSYDNIEWFSYIPKKYEWDATRTEYNSKDCGYVPPKEQSVHLYFTDGTEDWVFHPYSYIEPHYYDGINGIYGRNDIEKVEIGQMLIRIDDYAFANQPNLKEAYFEDYVIDSANNIFFGDQMLCKVNDNPRGTLRLSTEVLGNGAFNYTAFDTIILDEGNKSIGVSTFASMGNLTSVTLPSTVETISGSAFYNCFSLDNIDIAATTPPQIEFDTFLMVKEYGKLNTPNGSDYSQWLSFDEFYLGYYHWRERIGDYDVKLTFQDGTTQLDTYSDGRIPSSAYTSGTTIVKVEIGDRITEIGNYAFEDCSSLTSIDSLNCTYVGENAFQYCSSLTSVNLPNCTTVDEYAFASCSSLTSVNLPSCTSVGYMAFFNCTSLTSVNLPICTSVSSYAFYSCTSLTSIDLPSCITVGNSAFRSCGSLTSANLSNCTSVASYAFQECSRLTSVNLPICTSVSSYAFYSCTSLTSIDLPSCTTIGSWAFYNCTSLTSVNLPICTSVSSYAFRSCGSLTSVNIPNCTSISYYAFDRCSNLTSIDLPSCTTIGSWAFQSCSSLTSIIIPDSVTTIGNSAFNYCSSLESVDIGSGVTSINNETFQNCSKLKNVNISDSVTSIGEYAFNRCPSISSITIPSSVTDIGNSAFYGCSSLDEIKCLCTTQPSITSTTFRGVKEYGTLYHLEGVDFSEWLDTSSYMLGYYHWNESIIEPPIGGNYVKITFVDGTTRIDTYDDGVVPIVNPYYGNDTIKEVEIGSGISKLEGNTFSGCTNIISVSGNCTAVIPMYAFAKCINLVEVSLPYVEIIQDSAFNECTNLQTVNLPNIKDMEGCFSFCESLTSVTLGDELTRIGHYTFIGCTSLTNITIPNSVTTIGNYVFKNCTNLTNIILGNSVTSIGISEFEGCTSLTSITIPDSVVVIDQLAFLNCTNLDVINIGSGLTKIGIMAFNGCRNLSAINIEATTAPSIERDTFSSIGSYGTLTYPSGSNYSKWLSNDGFYLGFYHWNGVPK